MRGLLVMIFALFVAASPAAAQPAPAPAPAPDELEGPTSIFGALTDPLVRIAVRPVGDGWVRPGEWGTLHVRLANLGDPLEGELVVRARGTTLEEVVHRRVVELPAGTRRDISLPWRGPMGLGEHTVAFNAGRRSVSATFKVNRVEPGDVLIGVVGDDAGGIQTLRATHTGPVPARDPMPPTGTTFAFDEDDEDEPAFRTVRTGLMPLVALPEHEHGYAAFNEVVWLDADPSALSPGRAAALRGWVAGGGHLVLTVTDRWRQVADGPLADLLPATPSGLRDGGAAASFSRMLGGDGAGLAPQAVLTPRDVPGRHTVALLEDAGDPVWVVGTYGLGTVTLVAFDPRSTIARSGLDPERAWRAVLHLPAPGGSASPILGVGRRAGGGAVLDALGLRPSQPGADDDLSPYDVELQELEASLVEVFLRDIPGVEPIPITWLIAFSTLYLLLIGPVDFVVLRWLRREVLTWITFPILIVVFSGVALIGITYLKGTQAVMTRHEVVDLLPGTDLWRGTALYGVWSTQRAKVGVRSGFDGGIGEPVEGHGYLVDAAFEHGPEGSEGRFTAQTWALAFARTSWTAPRKGTLRLTAIPGGYRLHNELPFDLDASGVCLDGDTWELGRVAAGATVDLLIEVEEPTFDETGPIGTACAYRAGRRGSLAAREPAVLAVGLASAAVEPYTVVGIQPTVVNRTLIRAPLAALPGSESDR
jgi:hypothetical protein